LLIVKGKGLDHFQDVMVLKKVDYTEQILHPAQEIANKKSSSNLSGSEEKNF
jgi:hypothetical protein